MPDESKDLGRDVREVIDDIRASFQAVQDDLQARIWTAFPIKFEDYDEKKQTGKVKALIKSVIRKKDGKVDKVEIPQMEDCPVYFASGGREDDQGQQGGGGGGGSGPVSAGSGGQEKSKGYMMSFPIKKGDEGIAVVSCRTIDKWHDEGGTQDSPAARMHDLSDLMILPGIKSRPRAEEVKDGTNKDSPEFRSVNGDHKYGMTDKEDGGLYSNTKAHIKNAADKNVENEAGEDMNSKAKNMNKETKEVDSAKAGKAIVKKAPKVLINST